MREVVVLQGSWYIPMFADVHTYWEKVMRSLVHFAFSKDWTSRDPSQSHFLRGLIILLLFFHKCFPTRYFFQILIPNWSLRFDTVKKHKAVIHCHYYKKELKREEILLPKINCQAKLRRNRIRLRILFVAPWIVVDILVTTWSVS